MELDELILAWKSQEKYINQNIKAITFNHLLRQKSKGILSRIVKRLTVELIVLLFLLAGFNLLFFIIKLPYSILRWTCFVIFNLVIIGVTLNYLKAITQSKIDFRQNLDTTLAQIIN